MAVYLGKHKVGMVKKFTPVDRLQWKCDNVKSLQYEFYNHNVEDLQPAIQGLDTSNVTNMSYMFARNSNGGVVKKIDLSHFNTSNVTTFYRIFQNCISIEELDVSHFDTAKATNMSYMFSNCKKLENLKVSHFNTSNVSDFSRMFESCQGLTSLDLTGWDTSKATTLANMFTSSLNLVELKGLENFNTSKVTNMANIFASVQKLELLDISGFDTSKVTNMSNMFGNSNKIKEILGVIDMYSATNVSNMLNDTGALEKVTLKNIRKTLLIGSKTSYGTNLKIDSLINTIKELWDYSSGTTTYTLTMSTASKELIADVYVKLVDVTDEMLAQDQYADQKLPCVVCESTDEGAMLITDYATAKGWTIA